MEQLDIFGATPVEPKRKIGRPPKILKEVVFAVIDDINKQSSNNKKLTNKVIIQKHNISERTFFRIKNGHYDNLFKKALSESVQDFSLEHSI